MYNKKKRTRIPKAYKWHWATWALLLKIEKNEKNKTYSSTIFVKQKSQWSVLNYRIKQLVDSSEPSLIKNINRTQKRN